MILQDEYCNRCNKEYTDAKHYWCRACLKNFANFSSENDMIDDFIQEMQLKINSYDDIIFEWISYDQFNDIKEIDKDDFSIVYSATWNGPLKYDTKTLKYERYRDKVALECLYDSQNNTDEFCESYKHSKATL